MLSCEKCLENNWETKYNEGLIIATCNNCGNEISFEAVKRKKNIIKEGDLCRHCKNPVIFRESKFNKKKLKKEYYYTGYFYCKNCRAIYYSNKFKIYN